MEYTKGYKFRIYPTKAQVQTIEQTLGCCRFVYNHFLALRTESWKTKKESVTYVVREIRKQKILPFGTGFARSAERTMIEM